MDDWEPTPAQRRALRSNAGPIWIAAGAAGAALAAGYWYFTTQKTPPPPPVVEIVPDAGFAPDAEAALPPEEGDALLRKTAAETSNSSDLSKWLEAPGVLQRFAAAARMVAQGESPRPVLDFIVIDGELLVKEQGNKTFLAKESYARYDTMTKVFATTDPDAAARAYRQLKPFFDSTFRQVAQPGERFDDVLAAAMRRLVAVQMPKEPIELVPKGAIYLFRDPTLEALGAGEKHLIRMGPENAKKVQSWLRQFARAAGIATGQ
jgi:hypothetical protein